MSEAFDWEELLLLIEDEEVIPIVGRELVVVSVDGTEAPLERHVASRLAAELGLPADQLSERPDLNEVAVLSLREAGRKASTQKRLIQKKIAEIVSAQDFPVPEPLRKLAAIDHFNLFVSTTFDSLLGRALDQVRFDGEETTRTLAYYTQREEDDVPDNVRSLAEPTVYQIFGSLESATDFAVTDEDCLEILHRLQDTGHQPRTLFDELRESNLLFLGCGLPDGLARVFLRTVANQRLFCPSNTYKIADSQARENASLSLFLRHCDADLYISGGAAEFVDALYEKYTERAPQPPRRSARQTRTAALPRPEPGSVFLSYKSEDAGKVTKLKEELERAGLQVWFDKGALQGGDDWDREIEKAIEACTLFLPVISKNAQVVEGEFRREWTRALKRAERIPREVPFIIAVLIDGYDELRRREGDADPLLIPPEFWSKQYLACPGGAPTAEFARTVREKMREVELLRAGR